MNKTILYIILGAVIISYSTVVSCGNSAGAAETSAEKITETEDIVISSEKVGSLAVIRSDTSDREITDSAVNLRKAIEQSLGNSITISTDWKKNPVFEYELIVGKTYRENTENISIDYISFGEKGYIIKTEKNKIFITGGSNEATINAVNFFIETFIDGTDSDGTFSIPRDYEYVHYQEYDVPNIYIDGRNSQDYKILCDENNNDAAEYLRDMLYSKSGVWHEISNTSAADDIPSFVISSKPYGANGIMHAHTTENGSLVFEDSSSQGIAGTLKSFCDYYLADAFGSINFPNGFNYTVLGDYIIKNN